MPKLVEYTQGSAEWLAWKRGKIGASHAPTIMGENPWKTRYQLWSQILEDEHEPMNDAMKKGVELEPVAREKVSAILEANYAPQCMESNVRGWQIASLDGWCASAKIKTLEIKCPGAKTHAEAEAGRVPKHYMAQLQHQMEVSETDAVVYCSYFNEAVCIIEVYRDDAYISKMNALEAEFYDRLCSFMPPECDDRDYLQISDPEALQHAKRYFEVTAELKKLEELQEAIKKNLITAAAHKNAKIGDVKITKVVRKGNVDYQQIEALKGLDLESYRKKPITTWRVS
jgi:putative phage-type endonuclease